MNIARKISSIQYNHFHLNLCRKLKISARNYDSAKSETQIQEEKFDFEDLKIQERVERRKASIPPFMKDIFMSVFNKDLLAYPEILNKEESTELDQRVEVLQKVFDNPKSTKDEKRKILGRTGMYGAPVALTNGGLAMNFTESLSYLDVISDLQLGQELSDHWVCLNVLKLGLSSNNYQKIIGDLISGDVTIGLCVQERITERILQADFNTTAELKQDGTWKLNGEKICQTTANFLIVLCIIDGMKFRAFLVHPNAAGVHHQDNFVSFRDTPATPLSEISEQVLSQTLGRSRLYSANLCRNSLLRTMRSCAEYVRPRYFCGKPLADVSTIKAHIGDTLVDTYACESAEYLTAGLIDGYMDSDTELEVAMCRNFISNHAQSQLLKLLAIPGVEHQGECLQTLEEMRRLTHRGETVESINMFIALNGIHYAGRKMATDVQKLRNPLFNPSFILKKIITDRHQERDDPKLELYLSEHLHPTLKQPSEQLEYCVMRIKYIVESMMSRHGVDIVSAYTELNRIAEATTEIFMMTSALARASRAYCIGLRNGELEMKLAACFVDKSKDQVKRILKEISDGEFINLDHFRIQFGKRVLDSNTLIEKPTARVFW